MGAADFIEVGHGENVQEAFESAREVAGYERGYEYSGTVSSKSEFVIITDEMAPNKAAAVAEADKLIRSNDSRISDKYGPAGAIPFLDENETLESWLFFGWAPE